MHLKNKLEYHYKAFDRTSIAPDPLQFLHLFSDRNNIELTGFTAAVFAYGNVKQIISSMNKFIELSSGNPFKYISSGKFNRKKLFKHRFYTVDDVYDLFILLHYIYNEFGSIENYFMKYYIPGDPNIKHALAGFSTGLLSSAAALTGSLNLSSGIKFMFPSPDTGSACKRMNLFLRWMVRKDELDFGLWKGIRKNQLVIPVDTHIARICKQLKLTTRKNISWNMAEEITANLKKYDKTDPVKYDFAICHIGMRKMKL